MIDSGLSVPLLPAAWFHLRQFFWFNVWPVIVGFTTILCYQIYMRIGWRVYGTKRWCSLCLPPLPCWRCSAGRQSFTPRA